ncbi:MAG TPA: alpha/beta hydrolase [Ilumatobacteraceae bacterium]|nr:alpha/beta hydrolase [Ilumatobacteraceae bacterium]
MKIWSHESGDADAPLIALVHGTMDRSAGLLRLSRCLDQAFRVLRYDRRGYGRSAPHPGPFGADQQVNDLVGLLEGRRALVFGHSYGGNVALATAARHPELVVAVAVYETPLSWLDWWPGSTAGADAIATRGDPADAAERFVRRLVSDARWEKLPPSTREARRSEGPAMVGELVDLREHAPWSADRLRMPVVAIYGERGAAHHRAGTEHLARVLPDCRVVEVAAARHFGPNTHPEAVAAAIVELASRVGYAGAARVADTGHDEAGGDRGRDG